MEKKWIFKVFKKGLKYGYKKNKLLDQEKNSDEDEKTEKFARNNLNLKKEGEETYKISE